MTYGMYNRVLTQQFATMGVLHHRGSPPLIIEVVEEFNVSSGDLENHAPVPLIVIDGKPFSPFSDAAGTSELDCPGR